MESTFFHFLKQQSTVPSGSNFSFNWIILLSQSFILANGNVFFVCWKHHLFYSEFFLLIETINEIMKSLFLGGHLFFRFCSDIFQKEATFPKVETSFSISFIRLVETDILLSRKSIFLVRAIWLLVATIIGNRSKQSKKELIVASGQLIFWLLKTIFFSIFKRLLPVIVFFRLVEISFSMKSFIGSGTWKQAG